MTNKLKQRESYPILVIHSTDTSFGFGYRKNNNLETDELFIKKFDNDLCNNLINDLDKFISKENLQNLTQYYLQSFYQFKLHLKVPQYQHLTFQFFFPK